MNREMTDASDSDNQYAVSTFCTGEVLKDMGTDPEHYSQSRYNIVGTMADDKMTADVKAAYNAASGDEGAKRAAANARAEEMMQITFCLILQRQSQSL